MQFSLATILSVLAVTALPAVQARWSVVCPNNVSVACKGGSQGGYGTCVNGDYIKPDVQNLSCTGCRCAQYVRDLLLRAPLYRFRSFLGW